MENSFIKGLVEKEIAGECIMCGNKAYLFDEYKEVYYCCNRCMESYKWVGVGNKTKED